ncbi:hypothetical protein AL710_06960 [Clostridium botulinum]|nr:hypothetical protein AL710_06960 [Clostridium botulinum]
MKKIKCSEIIDVRDGTHDSPRYQSKGYPLVTSKNIKGNKIDFNNVNFISEEDYNKINMRSAVHNGDILMPMIGTIGNPVLVNTNKKFAIKNVALFKLSNNNKVDSKYFYYLLTSDIVKNQLENRKRGGTQNFVSLSNIRSLEIPLVPIEKQIFISNILDKAKSLIDKRKAQIEDLDELVKSRFIEMFGDPIINSKGWKIELLGNVCEMKAGKNIKAADICEKNLVGLYPCYGGNGLRGYVKEHSHEGNIPLIGRQGALCGNVKYARGKFYATEHAVVTKPKIEMNNYWLYFVLSELNLNRLSTGAAQPGLTIGKLNEVEFPMVPIELQNEFKKFADRIDKLKFEMEKSLKELEDNFNSFMQKAFKGELFN